MGGAASKACHAGGVPLGKSLSDPFKAVEPEPSSIEEFDDTLLKID